MTRILRFPGYMLGILAVILFFRFYYYYYYYYHYYYCVWFVVAESWATSGLAISLTRRILWHYMNESETTTGQETSGDGESAAQFQVQ